ncbi:hypothetical protein [Streptomyces sp. ISL-100]|uniref:hypothetical protein n=1 Tax=Streptomyces sp. ISL-100 TaxID=2819173 RepID=UPI001BE800B9|nr:hypothetical protein [Streptomyces sp. ISL-100]MBT2401114.1 hypothetical protein [Streptomyces sp. ISL-100]
MASALTAPFDNEITIPYTYLRQYVVFSTIKPDIDPAVTVVPGDPLALVRELKLEEGTGLGIWLCGGGKLAGALLPEIDELVRVFALPRRHHPHAPHGLATMR